MNHLNRVSGCLVLSLCMSWGAQANPMKFLEAVDKAMKDYGTDIVAEGDANLNTIHTIGGKLMHPTKWKELGTDVDAGMKAYGDALTKTGDDALANSKAMFDLLISVRTYVPEFVLKVWDKLIAALHGSGGQVSQAAGSSWAGDGSLPPGGAGGDTPFADPSAAGGGAPGGGAPGGSAPGGGAQASEIRASATRQPVHALSDSERDGALRSWIDMRTAAAGLWKMSKQSKPEGKAKMAAAMSETIRQVRSYDAPMMGHLIVNPKATSQLMALLERGTADERAAMGDVISQLNRAYTDQARSAKAKADVKSAAAAVSKAKAQLGR